MRSSFIYINYFVEAASHTVTLHCRAFRGADLFNVSLYDDIVELLVQLDGAADAVGLLTGNERGAGTAEGI